MKDHEQLISVATQILSGILSNPSFMTVPTGHKQDLTLFVPVAVELAERLIFATGEKC